MNTKMITNQSRSKTQLTSVITGVSIQRAIFPDPSIPTERPNTPEPITPQSPPNPATPTIPPEKPVTPDNLLQRIFKFV